jgi:hypothetical protein
MTDKAKAATGTAKKATPKTAEIPQTIYAALAQFQSQCPAIKKDSEAGTKFKYKYGSLPHVLDEIKTHMAAAGLGFTQPIVTDKIGDEPREFIKTILFHVVDENTIESMMELPDFKFDQMNVMQSKGSIITYLRRYAIMSILGIVAEEDDNDAQGDGKKAKKSTYKAKDGAKAQPTTQAVEKPWLNPEEGGNPNPTWTQAVKYLADGGTIDDVKKKYRIGKNNEERLLNEALTFDDLPFDREAAEIASTENVGADELQGGPGETPTDGPNTLFDEQGGDNG